MKLIVDAGGSNTQVAYIDQKEIVYRMFDAYNANYHDTKVLQRLLDQIISMSDHAVSSLEWYGAGLTPAQAPKVKIHIQNTLTLSIPVRVQSDLELCAKSCQRMAPIIVGILGTGANIGHFNGHDLTRTRPSVGYLLVEEGSGKDIGRRCLKQLLYGTWNHSTSKDLLEYLEVRYDDLITLIYRENGFEELTGKVCRWAASSLNVPEVYNIVMASMNTFVIDRLIPEMSAHPETQHICLFGSVAHHFKKIVEACLLMHEPEGRLTCYQSALPLYAQSML